MKRTPELVAKIEEFSAKGMTQAKIGEALGLGQSTVGRWLNPLTIERDARYYKKNKEIITDKQRKYRQENKGVIAVSRQKYRQMNKEAIATSGRKYRQENKEKIVAQGERYRQENKEAIAGQNHGYRQRNRGRINQYVRDRRKTDIQFRLSRVLRTRLWNALKGNFKAGSAVADLGCSVADLKRRLEFCFEPDMTWDNYGEWHIDHIRPLAKFDLTDQEQFLQANNFTNLQPMWAEDNYRKGSELASFA